jgi:hypothetical protein
VRIAGSISFDRVSSRLVSDCLLNWASWKRPIRSSPDVQKLFRDKFGRDMTADERKWFALAEHAVRNEEEKRQ